MDTKGGGCNNSYLEVITNSRFPNLKLTKISKLYENGFVGDTSILLKTEVAKKFLFPKFEGEKFIPEEWMYYHIDKEYDYMLLPEIIIMCEYLSDGYTKNGLKLIVNNIRGVCLDIDYKIGCITKLKNKILEMMRYIGFSKLAKYKDAYKNSSHKGLYFFVYPMGFMYYIRKKKQLKIIKEKNG